MTENRIFFLRYYLKNVIMLYHVFGTVLSGHKEQRAEFALLIIKRICLYLLLQSESEKLSLADDKELDGLVSKEVSAYIVGHEILRNFNFRTYSQT